MLTNDSFNKAAATAVFELSAYEPAQLTESHKPEIVFSGKSNVGKSSMINKLISRKSLARVSSAPGKTASINFYDCGLFRLVDLPGYGYAKVSKQDQTHWSELVDGYFAQDRNIALIVQLVDARHAPSADDRQMIEFLTHFGYPFLITLTKTDKLKPTQFAKRKEEIPLEIRNDSILKIFTSAETDFGMADLKAEIIKAVQEKI